MAKKFSTLINLVLAASIIITLLSMGHSAASADRVQQQSAAVKPMENSTISHRLIVQLQSPAVAEWAKSTGVGLKMDGRLNLKAAATQSYIQQLIAEQAAFVVSMKAALPLAEVGEFIDENKASVQLTYQIVYNGLVVEPGMDVVKAAKILSALPGVKGVYFDYAHDPEMYASLPLINAAGAWNNPVIGGMANAGAGVKIASMDGGIYGKNNLAPMFSGVGFSYPAGWPAGGLGYTANNNGKVIVSRAYFRAWDPPAAGEETPWPGATGTSHGVHTSGILGGNQVIADYLGVTETISGVAPQAWLMSYRVFYNSINGIGSFYTAEGIAAFEDIVADGADVQNNSWGGGPGSLGNQFDPLDAAANNAANAGVFISFSAGNAGPELGTSDHPGDDYIIVGNSTTAGTIASGSISVSAPTPISTTLQSIPYGIGLMGPALSNATYNYKTAASAGNIEGCGAPADPTKPLAFPAGSFTGVAALISRGTCSFGEKVYNAQAAGATFVVIHSALTTRYDLINMSCTAAYCGSITIPSLFIRYDPGKGMESWYNQFGAASAFTVDTTTVKQVGNIPDVMANSSSRGPGANMTLKPDITAPGTNILSAGYKPNETGEARHLGYGQASGTSMASPHVAGAAALLRQIHPTWPNWYIKSALMTTSKYLGIYNANGAHAQPLDMGAGRLDLTNAADPGVVINPQSASFGLVQQPAVQMMHIYVTSVASMPETYNLSGVKVSATGWAAPTTSAFTGLAVSPSAITLNPGETTMITLTLNSAAMTVADQQGFVVMDGATYDAHFAVWGRVMPAPTNDILLIDADACSTTYPRGCNYRPMYEEALKNLGKTYDVLTSVPAATTLQKYKLVILYTGINYTGATAAQEQALVQFANGGGKIIAMGQDLWSWTNEPSSGVFFYDLILGGSYVKDTVSNNLALTLPVINTLSAPLGFQNTSIDMLARTAVAANSAPLLGSNVVPMVTNQLTGIGNFYYFEATNYLTWDVTLTNPLTDTLPVTVTAITMNTGAAGVNGPIFQTFFTGAQKITTAPMNRSGYLYLTDAQEATLKAAGYYINVTTTAYPAGELRAQVVPSIDLNGDGANLLYMDEINSISDPGYEELFQYPGPFNTYNGLTAMAHRDQPTLEKPGLFYLGRSIYTTFGLENINNGIAGAISRENLLQKFLNWLYDEPTSSTVIYASNPATSHTTLQSTLTSNIAGVTGVQYRWDFGDGTPYTAFQTYSTIGHQYQWCGLHEVRVEIIDSLGNSTVSTSNIYVTACTNYRVIFPLVFRP